MDVGRPWFLAPLLMLFISAAAHAQNQAGPAEAGHHQAAQMAEAGHHQDAQTSQQPADPWKGIQFGATLEGFYQYNWNEPYDRVNLLRAYDTRANVFGIQQVALVIESAPKVDEGRRFGARIDLQFGQATETVQGSAANEPRPDVYRHIWQAYGTYVFPVGRGLQTDFGKFASMLGYETNYAKDDNQFSRAYLFNFLPFYHSGLRVSLPISDTVTAMYMLTNGIQQTEDFNNFKSNHLAAIVKPTSQVTWTINYYFGQEHPSTRDSGSREPAAARSGQAPPTSDSGSGESAAARSGQSPDGYFRVFDTYVSYAPTTTLSFGLDANYVTNEVYKADPETALQGVGAYARHQFTGPVAISARYERLDDEGLFGGIDQVLQEATATLEYKFADGFLVRGEFRRDWSNEHFFTTADPDVKRGHQNTVLVGMVWWFGNKTGAW